MLRDPALCGVRQHAEADTALDIALEKKDPKKKLERRKKRDNSSKGKSLLNERSLRLVPPPIKQEST